MREQPRLTDMIKNTMFDGFLLVRAAQQEGEEKLDALRAALRQEQEKRKEALEKQLLSEEEQLRAQTEKECKELEDQGKACMVEAVRRSAREVADGWQS